MNANKNIVVVAGWYLLGILLVGLAYIFITPIFEGFDETAHYSSIKQIALTKTIPIYGKSFVDQGVESYRGPKPYSSGTPPFDGDLVSSKFFANADDVSNYTTHYRNAPQEQNFKFGAQPNWQAQHPPLYYLLMAPVYDLTASMPFFSQFRILRVLSYLLAFLGVFFACLGMLAKKCQNPGEHLIGLLAYPLILPMFFLEFGRLGNDSLCLALSGIAYWITVSGEPVSGLSPKRAIALGLTCGLGLLTKAFFIPITFGTFAYLLWARLNGRKELMQWRELVSSPLLILLVALIVGGGWYAYKFMVYGDLSGSDEAVQVAAQGGMLKGLKANFHLFPLVRGLIVWLPTYQWAGTWSLARLPVWMQIPSIILLIVVGLGISRELLSRHRHDMVWWSVVITGLFLGGLVWHVFVAMALGQVPTSPGWYLHTIMPWVAPVIGAGLYRLVKTGRMAKTLLAVLFICTFLYQMVSTWCLITLYSACSIKAADKSFVFLKGYYCVSGIDQIFDRLSVIGTPTLFLACFAGGYICLGIACRQACRNRLLSTQTQVL